MPYTTSGMGAGGLQEGGIPAAQLWLYAIRSLAPGKLHCVAGAKMVP